MIWQKEGNSKEGRANRQKSQNRTLEKAELKRIQSLKLFFPRKTPLMHSVKALCIL